MTASIENMTKAQLVEMVAGLQAKNTLTLSVGKDTDNRGVVEYRFEDTQVTFAGKGEGECKTIQLDEIFSKPAVMAYLLRYAVKRATNDTCKTFAEVVERVELWEKGYATLADYKAATRVEPVKASKATSAKAPNIGGLTDAEIISTIENLGGEFDVIAATLMTVDNAMFAPAVKFLCEKHPEVATALKEKVEAKRVAAIEAQKASLAALFG
jgi:hypothetical protein